jgi:hypothetical protein
MSTTGNQEITDIKQEVTDIEQTKTEVVKKTLIS